MSAPMPSVPSTIGFERAAGPRVADRVVQVRARVVHDRARQRRVRGARRGRASTSRRARGEPRRPRARRPRLRRRGCARRHRGRAASPHTASSVSSQHVNAACTPTSPRRPPRRNRSFSARPGLGAVGAVAVGDLVARRPPAHRPRRTRPRSRRGCPRSRRATRDGRRSRSCPLSSASSAPSIADHREHLEVERDVEPPPDLLEDLGERRRRARRRGHAPRERGVEVVVRADEPGRRRAREPGHSSASARRLAAHRQRGPPLAVEVVQRGGDRARRSARGRSRRRP